MYACMYMSFLYVCMFVSKCMYVYINVYVCAYIHVCMYVCMYVWKHVDIMVWQRNFFLPAYEEENGHGQEAIHLNILPAHAIDEEY